MDNALQQAKNAFGNIGTQLKAIPQIFEQRAQNKQLENLLPKEGMRFVPGQPYMQVPRSWGTSAGTPPAPKVLGKATQSPTASPVPTVTPQPQSLAPRPANAAEMQYGRNPRFYEQGGWVPSPQVIDATQRASTKFNVPKEFLYDLFAQESSLDPSLVNTTPAGIAAGNPTGLAQFTDSTWADVMKYANDPNSSLYGQLPTTQRTDPYANAIAAAYLISKGQLGKWDASEDVWGQFWPVDELDKMGFYNQSKYHIPGVRASDRLKGKSKR